MIVYVVVSDYGLNGAHVHGVYTERPDDKAVTAFTHNSRDWPGGYKGAVASTTGYANTQVLELELDAPFS